MLRKSGYQNLFFLLLTTVLFVSCIHNPKNRDYERSEKLHLESMLRKAKGFSQDTLEIKRYLNSFISSDREDSSMQIVYYGLLGNSTAKYFDRLNGRSERYYQKSIDLAEKETLPAMRVWSLVNYGFYLYSFRQNAEALPFFMEAVFLINKIGDERVIYPADTFKKLGFFFGTLGNYDDAISYLNKANRYADYIESQESATLLDNIGFYHLHNGDTVSAIKHFLEAQSIAFDSKNYVRYGKVLGNIALIYFNRGEYGRALKLVNRDLAYSMTNNSQNTMYAQVLKARILLHMDSISRAEEMLDEAEKYAASKEYLKKDVLEIARLRLQIASIRGNDSQELLIRRRLEVLEQVVGKLDGERVLLQNKWRVDKERNINALIQSEANYQSERSKRIILTSVVFLIGFGLVFVLLDLRRSARARALKYEKKVMELQLKKVVADKQLLAAHETLASYKDYLTEKNRQIDDLQHTINNIEESRSYYLEKEKGLLKELLDSHLLTEENWASFKRSFDTHYPNFYVNLKSDFPELTESNMRYIILSKLGLSTVEISNLLGVSNDSVKKSRQRLKKKIGDRFKEFEQAIYN